nr:putative retrotransposon protein [Tanacetum cinerariifolium]
APIQSTKEPEHLLSMGYEHPSITPETESNAENLLPIPSKCEEEIDIVTETEDMLPPSVENKDDDYDLLLGEADLFLFNDLVPHGIENFADDPEGDIRFLEELLIDDSTLSDELSDANFEENPSIPRPPPELPDAETDAGEEIQVVMIEPEIQQNLETLHAREMLLELKTLFAQQAEQELLQTTRVFHSCKQEEWQSVSSYVLKMKCYIDNLERLGHPVTLGLGLSLILIGLRKEFDGFVQNYNMHSPGMVLNNWRYAPSVPRGVISVSRLYEDGFINRFVNNTIQVSRNNMVYFSAIPRDGIFEIDLSNSYTNESSIYSISNKRAKLDLDSAILWHCRLGHISKKRIEKLSTRIRHALDHMCLYINVVEHELGDLGELANYKAALLDPESEKCLNATNVEMQSMKDNKDPCDLHWTTVKSILKYLKNTKDMFLVYGGDLKRELRVSCYTDVGYLTNANDLKSQTGYVLVVLLIGRVPSKAYSLLHHLEAEYIAAFDASNEALWVRKFISGLSVVPTIKEPIRMYYDNTREIAIANESGITKGVRHFRAKVHYLREVIEYGDIKLEKVYTDDNLADPFTKALAFPKHSEHTRNIGMLPASSLM